MSKMLLGISPEKLYIHKESPKPVSNFHRPYFLVFSPKERNIDSARNELINKWKNNKLEGNTLSKIEKLLRLKNFENSMK